MSENLDLVRSIYAAWERGDFGSGDWANPRIEFAFIGGLEPTTGIGLAAMGDVMRAVLIDLDAYRVEAEDFRELDGDRVLVLSRATGRGKTSGLDLGQMSTAGASLFHIRDGKVIKLVNYWDRDRALGSKFGGWPEQQTYEGPEKATSFLTNWLSSWEDWELTLVELLDAGEKVVALMHQTGRSKTTETVVEMSFAQVWTVRDGKQTRIEMYSDPAEALQAVGLAE